MKAHHVLAALAVMFSFFSCAGIDSSVRETADVEPEIVVAAATGSELPLPETPASRDSEEDSPPGAAQPSLRPPDSGRVPSPPPAPFPRPADDGLPVPAMVLSPVRGPLVSLLPRPSAPSPAPRAPADSALVLYLPPPPHPEVFVAAIDPDLDDAGPAADGLRRVSRVGIAESVGVRGPRPPGLALPSLPRGPNEIAAETRGEPSALVAAEDEEVEEVSPPSGRGVIAGPSEPVEAVGAVEVETPARLLDDRAPELEREAVALREGAPVPGQSAPDPAPEEPAVRHSGAAPIDSVATVDVPVLETAPGREVRIELPGSGWVYIGEAARRRDMVFLDREATTRVTGFAFRFEGTGDYSLNFTRQDLSRGVSENRVYQVAVVQGDTDAPAAPLPDVVALTDPATAEPAPGGEAGRQAQEASPSRGGESIVFDPQPEPDPLPHEVFRSSVSSGDAQGAAAALGALNGELAWADAGLILDAALLFSSGGHVEAAIRTLEQYRDRPNRRMSMDEVYFRLGALYEQDSDGRNLRRAKEYYERITAEFPLSRHWEAAVARIEYLNRHFFHLR